MNRRHVVRTAVGAAAITIVIAGSAVARAGSEPRPPDGDVVETLAPDGQEIANEEVNPAPRDPAADTQLLATNDEVNPPIRAEDAPELAASIEGVADAGNGYADPALDVGGVDGSVGADQDG